MDVGGGTHGAPPTLDEARFEFRGPLPRLADHSSLELAAVGISRRAGVLTAVSLAYFDLRSTVEPPQKPDLPAPNWLSDWIARQIHPLLDAVIQVWTQEEFGDGQPSAELMLRTSASTEVEPYPIAEALVIEGNVFAGFGADSDQGVLRAVEFRGVCVLVSLPTDLSSGTPRLTIH